MPIYSLSSLGVNGNKIVFNDFDYKYNTGVLFRVQKRMASRRELREFDIPLPEISGIADFQTLIGKSYFTIEGIMYPDDEVAFDRGRDALRKACSLDYNQADLNTDDGFLPYSWGQTGGDRMLWVKPLYVDIPESTQGLVQPFRILCKVKRPVIYSATPVTGFVGLVSNPVSSGNASLSFTLPRALGATTYANNGQILNAGDLATYPAFTITGPCANPRVTNNTTGEFIQVNVTLSPGDNLTIVYDEEHIAINRNGVSVYGQLATGSTLFKLKPGVTTFTFAGATDPSAQVNYSFYSAWPES